MKKLALLWIPAVLLAATPAFADDAPAAVPAAPTAPALTPDLHPDHGHMTPEERAAWKAKWDAMTPAERKAKADEWIAKREAKMTPEEKAAFEARRAKWEAMTPAERKAAREAHHHGGHHDHGKGK